MDPSFSVPNAFKCLVVFLLLKKSQTSHRAVDYMETSSGWTDSRASWHLHILPNNANPEYELRPLFLPRLSASQSSTKPFANSFHCITARISMQAVPTIVKRVRCRKQTTAKSNALMIERQTAISRNPSWKPCSKESGTGTGRILQMIQPSSDMKSIKTNAIKIRDFS